MMTTFKERLKILMNGEKPYAWIQKVGIEKGLFQYYWQKERIPSFKNLIKIQRYSGCSLDWLVTGKAVDLSHVKHEEMKIEQSLTGKRKNTWEKRSCQFFAMTERLKNIYAEGNLRDIEALEYFINAISNRNR